MDFSPQLDELQQRVAEMKSVGSQPRPRPY
jgi:hypothetical protein